MLFAVSELCLVKKPSLFVPLPSAAEDHQTKNAMVLVNRQAAKLVKDELVREKLADEVLALINNEAELQKMSAQMAPLGYHDAADLIASEALKLIE